MTDDTTDITAEPAAEAAVAEPLRMETNHGGGLPEAEVARITEDLIGVLKTVYDPEIPVDIYELGLIYKVDLDDDRNLTIDMTLTAPGCPVAGEMPGWVENAARSVEGIQDVTVNMVFDPPWDASRMSEEAQVALNWW
jgi:FeS assembly SUF system protein